MRYLALKPCLAILVLLIVGIMPIAAEDQPSETPTPTVSPVQPSPFPEEVNHPTEFGNPNFLKQMLEMLLMLGLMLGFLLLITWFLRRMTSVRVDQLNVSSTIKILERRLVSNRTTIFLIDINGERITFAESVNGVTALHPAPPKPRAFQPPIIEEKKQP